MDRNKLIKTLEQIGLDEKEAQVYLASLSLGPTTVLALARTTALKRTTVYSIIDNLKQKGLMNVQLAGLKQKFAAESPERLQAVLLERQETLKHSLPDLLALHRLEDAGSSIRYYEGLRAIKGVYDELLRLKPHDYYLAIANIAAWQGLDEKFFMSHVEQRAKLNLETRLLFQDSEAAQKRKQFERNYNEEVRILPAGTNLNTDLVITPNKVVIFQLTEPLTAFAIENRAVTELQKQLFELIWQNLKETLQSDG